MAAAAILDFQKFKILTSVRCKRRVCDPVPNFIKIGQTVGEIWQYNGFRNGGRPPSSIYEIQTFLTVGEVKRPILHQHTKFRKNRSNRCGDIAIFVIFQDGATAWWCLSLCQIWLESMQ